MERDGWRDGKAIFDSISSIFESTSRIIVNVLFKRE